jgi:hypothetical protein
LRFKQDRLRKIKEAMKSPEQQAKAMADAEREETGQEDLSPAKEGSKRYAADKRQAAG